ncbi:MAG: galactokinase [Maricaulaceae bacterium]
MTTDTFTTIFGAAPQASLFTPGRVNLIGEHTDYNGGMVLPMAIALGTTLAISARTDNIIRIYSDGFDGIAERSIYDTTQDHWSDYVVGAVIYAEKIGFISGGVDIAIQTNLPFGAGLSSSAALIVGILKACRDLSTQDVSDVEIAKLARHVENEFIGVPCGIMDQMAVATGTPGNAIALDTQTLEYDLIDLPNDYHIAVIHSGQHRKLSEGRYKIRKEECDAVKSHLGREDICQISDDDIADLSGLVDTLQRRAKHCQSEHRRVLRAVETLNAHDIAAFGRLMNESHISMRDDFDITLPAIDRLVEDAVTFGAVGARMTGGGFGGCIVACVRNDIYAEWKERLLAAHPKAFHVC